MAKIIITLTDGEELGMVDASIESDPPFDLKEDVTPAQYAAMKFLAQIKEAP